MAKRSFDIIFSLFGALLFFPLFVVLALISAIIYKGNIFFLQKRIGYKNEVFTIYKLRTMLDLKDVNGNDLPDVERLNAYGVFLRKSSFDEIPQLFNIFKGNLSVIGPRPLLVEYLDHFTQEEQLRHTIKPGLTGLAQVKGRNSIQWKERLEYDVYYVKNKSLMLDVHILIHTIFQIVKGQKIHLSSSLLDDRVNQA